MRRQGKRVAVRKMLVIIALGLGVVAMSVYPKDLGNTSLPPIEFTVFRVDIDSDATSDALCYCEGGPCGEPAEIVLHLGPESVTGDLSLRIVHGSEIVKRLVQESYSGKDSPYTFTWDGLTDAGVPADPGQYRIGALWGIDDAWCLDEEPIDILRADI